jgi:hypothetical protein
MTNITLFKNNNRRYFINNANNNIKEAAKLEHISFLLHDK